KMAEHLKKPFNESLQDIKERMKEKRSQKWIKFSKMSQFSAVKCKIITSTSKQTKSIQANNRALAQALQESKLKLKDAEDTILKLRKDYQDLKVQMFALQRNLRFMQAQGLVENRLSALNQIISTVSQNLLNSIDLLGPAKDLCSTGVGRNLKILCLLYTCNIVSLSTEQFNRVKSIFSHLCVKQLFSFNMTFSLLLQGQTSDFPILTLSCPDENVSSRSKDAFGNVLPKGVSSRPRYSEMRNRHELCTGVLDYIEACDVIEELSQDDDGITLEGSLEKCAMQNVNSGISSLNKNKVGSELVLRQIDSESAQSNLGSNSDLKKRECKGREDSQVRKEKQQKGKLECPKNTSRQRPKKRQKKELDLFGGSSDAYDFNFEERVHVTPFRQKRENDTDIGVDDKDDLSETNTSESSYTEEDSDDSLYKPYKSKSKKSSVDKEDVLPVHPRPRSKRCLAQHEQKLHNEKETDSSKSSDKSIMLCYKNHYIYFSVCLFIFSSAEIGIKDMFCLRNCLPELCCVPNFFTGQPSEPSRGHLCDVTNTASLLPSTGNATIDPEDEGLRSPKRKRSCTITVNYKEPSIAGKLRRGDPFTDTNFLNSPIFKQKKDAKRRSLKKAALPKYNEKFVGSR
ncbi:Shugoshin-like 1, partial [Cuculus canorus]